MRFITRLLLLCAFFFVLTESVSAGFGITPPYVRNSSLIRNATYEQEILLIRSDPSVPLKAQITIDVPGINDWFTIKEGREFLLPEGEAKVSMHVVVKVPDKADFKQYLGNIRIKTSAPDGSVSAGTVSISLGAQVDVDITVIDKEIKDFRVRKVTIHDLNEGHKIGWLYFPGKILFDIFMENVGNIPVAPSKVVFKIYDLSGQILFEETKHTNKIKKVAPFATDTVRAELPTRLPFGSYITRYEIWNGENIKQQGELNLNILPYGTLQAAGYGFLGLSLAHKISIILPILAVAGSIIATLIYRQNRRRKLTRNIR